MIEIKEIRKGEYWLTIKPLTTLDQTIGENLKKSSGILMDQNIHITIDLNQIRIINSKGYTCLLEIMKMSVRKKATIFFANIHPDIEELITTLDLSLEHGCS